MGQYSNVTNPLIYITKDGPDHSYSVAMCWDYEGTENLIAYDGTSLIASDTQDWRQPLTAVKEALDNAFNWGTESGIYEDSEEGARLTDSYQILIL